MTEELKSQLDYFKDEPKYLRKVIDELEQENKVLTRENENRNDWITSLNKKCEELIKEKLNYRSALEEIREICMSVISYDFIKEEIIDKINEVLGC